MIDDDVGPRALCLSQAAAQRYSHAQDARADLHLLLDHGLGVVHGGCLRASGSGLSRGEEGARPRAGCFVRRARREAAQPRLLETIVVIKCACGVLTCCDVRWRPGVAPLFACGDARSAAAERRSEARRRHALAVPFSCLPPPALLVRSPPQLQSISQFHRRDANRAFASRPFTHARSARATVRQGETEAHEAPF